MSAIPVSVVDDDRPAKRAVVDPPTRADRAFSLATSAAGMAVFGLLLVIGTFLLLRASGTIDSQGLSFLTRVEWRGDVRPPRFGVLGLLAGTLIVASIAVAIAVPVGIAASLYITQYAKPRTSRLLTGFVDLLAAVPALIYGIWGFKYLSPKLTPLAAWLSRHGSWFPPFETAPKAQLTGAFFGAGIVVSLMVIPIITAIVREVFAQAPAGEKEAALALGGSRWSMVRLVVIPYGRGGIVGASMLGLGRALGETIAVSLLLPQVPRLSLRIFENGGGTISGFIVQRAGSDEITVSALMLAGLVLFVITLGTNLVASTVIGRSRSGAGVDA
jgi:phosphate transport system permease protein